MAETSRELPLSTLTASTRRALRIRARQAREAKLSVLSKVCYAIGGAPNQVSGSASAFFLQIYLLDVALISPYQASLVLSLGKTWGGITDPIVGYCISKSKWTRIGRLMPWMLGCTPFLVVSYFLLWFVPTFETGRVLWYLAFFSCFQALSTAYHVPYTTLTMFLSTDQMERDSATAYRMTVEVLGTLIGAAVQGQIVASAHTGSHCNVTNMTGNLTADFLYEPTEYITSARQVYMIAAGIIGCLYLLCISVLFLGVKERDDPYALVAGKVIPFFKGFRETMQFGPYLNLISSFLLISAAVQVSPSSTCFTFKLPKGYLHLTIALQSKTVRDH
ncbi:hypothetical protein XENTR_v10015028 [Xenopus tropicalis]|nr:hypothetical protein XENTR_v10015028 [Xenopus tropicalis]